MGNCIFSSTVQPVLLEKKPIILSHNKIVELVEMVKVTEIVTGENKQQDQVSDLRIKIPSANIDAS